MPPADRFAQPLPPAAARAAAFRAAEQRRAAEQTRAALSVGATTVSHPCDDPPCVTGDPGRCETRNRGREAGRTGAVAGRVAGTKVGICMVSQGLKIMPTFQGKSQQFFGAKTNQF